MYEVPVRHGNTVSPSFSLRGGAVGNTHIKWKSNCRLPFFKILIFRMKSLRSPFSLIRVMLFEAMKKEFQVPEIWKERLSDGRPITALGLLDPHGHYASG